MERAPVQAAAAVGQIRLARAYDLPKAEAAALASLGDETPEGRSILDLATRRFGFTADRDGEGRALGVSRMVPFSAQTRISGIDLADGRAWVVSNAAWPLFPADGAVSEEARPATAIVELDLR